ncbi:hypothetical protein V5O48_017037, partial [Marasmius crinis-equi]
MNSPYALHTRLAGHAQLILCLAATEDGKLLASGGGDGTIVWSLEKLVMIQRLSTFGTRGGTTSLLWIHREDTLQDGLVYGTHEGYVVICKQGEQGGIEEVETFRIDDPSEITSLAYDGTASRLAVANRNGVVHMAVIEPSTMRTVREVWTIKIENSIPKSIAFDSRRDLLVFGMHDAIYCIDNGTGVSDPLRSKQHGVRLGHASCTAVKGFYLVDNIFNGATLYRMSDHSLLKEYAVPRKQQIAYPKQAVFGEDSSIVISGSDHGTVYVFELREGKLVQELDTRTGNWVQALTTSKVNEIPFIIAGEARPGEGGCGIFIFKKTGMFERFLRRAKMTLYGGMAVATAATLYRNLDSINTVLRPASYL